MSRFKPLLICIVLIWTLAPVPADAAVLTVGPNGMYPQVQDAVNAAQEGDIVLVAPGGYKSVDIVNLGVSVVGDKGGDVKIATMTLKNIPAHKTVTLSGLVCGTYSLPPKAFIGLTMENVKGSVRCEDCEFRGAFQVMPGCEAAHLDLCEDAAFIRCSFKGGSSIYDGEGGHGMHANQSFVTFYDCILDGGAGGTAGFGTYDGGDGGDGFYGLNSFLFTSGSLFEGGDGGDGTDGDDWYEPGDGGDGGDGIELAGGLSEGWILDGASNGGAGGEGGDGLGIWPDGSPGEPGKKVNADSNAVLYLDGTAHQLEIDSPAREGEAIQVVFKGNLGDHAVIALAADAGAYQAKALKGVFLLPLSPFPLFLHLGELSSGSLVVPITVPELGGSIDGMKVHTQSFFWNNSGEEVLGTAQTLVLLDKAF